SESELELGDKVRGEVRTQIRYGEAEQPSSTSTSTSSSSSSRRRGSVESGIHVRTTTTFEDLTGGARGKPFSLP
ncbi:hypothetical protein CTA2_11807, partial [Colletotrichum tanaceti]